MLVLILKIMHLTLSEADIECKMPCYFPLTAWKSANIEDINPVTGKLKMVFREDQGFPNTKMELPCGQCIGCRLDRARSWAARCLHEASLYQKNSFLTLTYSEENLKSNSLNKRDIQLFMKRLRRKYPEEKIRFFQCGEYGDQFDRPHHHIILFNFDPPDKVPFRKTGDFTLYLSPVISELWPHGLHSIGDVTYDSACYVAKYCLKKITGKQADGHYGDRLPEFTTMSRKPGIGKDWYDRFSKDLYNHDKCVVAHNHILRPPKYYDSMYELDNPKHFRSLKSKRRENASLNPENCEERREIKNKLAKIKEQQKALRNYEKGVTTPPAKRGG